MINEPIIRRPETPWKELPLYARTIVGLVIMNQINNKTFTHKDFEKFIKYELTLYPPYDIFNEYQVTTPNHT